MSAIATRATMSVLVSLILATSVSAQSLEVKRFNPSEWTKGRFTEIITVTGPGKTIYLAGVGAEDETAPAGASAPIRHLGDPYQQCVYAYDKIKRSLAAHGATLADVVKQVVRHRHPLPGTGRQMSQRGLCGRADPNTFLVINGLAIQGMLLEIDVTAVVAK
jgi:2-iminobutanoate/2-iminopropanoate deaminase